MKDLGRVAGHCPECLGLIGNKEIGQRCPKCGTLIKRDELIGEVTACHRQTASQYRQMNILLSQGSQDVVSHRMK